MISYTLTKYAMSLTKLQVTLTNFQSQLNMDKFSSLAKYTRIKSIEDLVVKVVYDPVNINATE